MRNIFGCILVLLIVLFSCDEKPCYEDMNTYFKIGFYTVEENVVVDTVLDSLKIYADGSNFGFIIKNASSIRPELSPHSDTTLFFLTLNNNIGDDYMYIRYRRKPYLVSHDCGFLLFFEDLEVFEYSTFHIDSVVVVNNAVNDSQKEHIKIFL